MGWGAKMEDLAYNKKKTNLGISLVALVKACQYTLPIQLYSQTQSRRITQ